MHWVMLGVPLRFPCWWSLAWILKEVVNTELEGLHVAHSHIQHGRRKSPGPGWFAARLGWDWERKEAFPAELGRQLLRLRQSLFSSWKRRGFSPEARKKKSKNY